MDILKELEKIGLNDKKAKVYLAVLEIGSASAAKIAQKAGVERTGTYDVLNYLKENGLVAEIIRGKKRLFVAEDPDVLPRYFEQQKIDLERDLTRKKQDFLDVLPQLRFMYSSASGLRPKVTYYEGKQGLLNLFYESLNCQKRETLFLWPAIDMIDVLGKEELEEYIKERVRRKIDIKVIRHKDKEIPYKRSGHGKEFFRDLRFAPAKYDFSFGIGIFDNKVAIISTKKDNFGLLLESQEFADTMKIFFDALWQVSTR